MTTLYLSASLFTTAERAFNQALAAELATHSSDINVILPQERAKTLLSQPDGYRLVFQDCLDAIKESHAVIGVLDGPDVDSGVCVEIGYALAIRIPIIGVRTDVRALQDRGLNLMVSQACAALLLDDADDIANLASKLFSKLRELSIL